MKASTFALSTAPSVTLLSLLAPALADVVRLDSGAVLVGEVRRNTDDGRDRLSLVLPQGELVLDRSRVAGTREDSPAHAEYRRRAPTVSDTADAQLALAAWCRNNGLADEHERHLQRVLRLDPDNAEARQALGYEWVEGAWLTREERLAARGLLRWRGEFRTAQEIELLRRRDDAETRAAAWRKTIARWRRDLARGDDAAEREIEDRLATLDDADAVGPLSEWLADERSVRWRRQLIRGIGRIGGQPVFAVLVDVALGEPDRDLRSVAVAQLGSLGAAGAAAPFVAALRSPDNRVVNRAGFVLARLGGASVAPPLIEALRTTHRVRNRADTPGETYSVNSGSGTFGFGNAAPTVEDRTVENPDVLAALVAVTGVNHLYDQASWRAWLAAEQASAPLDLRRDP